MALSNNKRDEIETAAQKEAIKCATLEGMRAFAEEDPASIWNMVYGIHVHRKSGVKDTDTIAKIIAADQSWKKSSGHAFEEMVKFLGSEALRSEGIEIVLQRDLSLIIKNNQLNNETRDISWLKGQKSNFDLFAIVHKDNNNFCFGCLQCKTSIRDRVSRDREPSIHAGNE
jgi:hypothetical protein